MVTERPTHSCQYLRIIQMYAPPNTESRIFEKLVLRPAVTLCQRRWRATKPESREVHVRRQLTTSCPICGLQGDIDTVTTHAAACSMDIALGEECELIVPRSKVM